MVILYPSIMKDFIVRTCKNQIIQEHTRERKSISVILPTRFKLQVGITMISSGGVNAVFVRNDLPELCTNLVAALSSLNVHELLKANGVNGQRRL